MSNYCLIAPGHPVHHAYHESEYGFPVTDERALFERLALEIMQAGLSWEIVLKKRSRMNKAFDRFALRKVAAYQEKDIQRLLGDEGIIRNRLKIEAIIENANRIIALRRSHGGFAKWIDAHHPLSKDEWVELFKKTFKFTGGEIVGEFLMSIGYLPGAHAENCRIFSEISKTKPGWQKAGLLKSAKPLPMKVSPKRKPLPKKISPKIAKG